MLNIHFSSDDLGRVRLATAPDPSWEMLLSLHALGGSPDHIVFGPWRATALNPLDPSISLLRRLAPPRGYSPDFLTPGVGTGLESAVDAVMSVGRARLRAELALLPARRHADPWMRGLALGEPETMRRLGGAMRRYHQRVLARPWPRIRAVIDGERALRARDLLDGGVERLLGNIHPLARWEPPVLRVDYPVRQDLFLNGRGLLLIPSYFCWRRPITLRDGELDPVLVYPANRGLQLLTEDRGTPQLTALARLLGRTRAAVLEEIASSNGTTGGELARRLGISAASASEHAATMRDANLIISRRVTNTVWHTLSPLGRALLEGRRPDDEPHAPGRARTGTRSA
ncbi:ArsR family transcriptional regulator [Streptomyces sp. TRM72054]|uniref:MarR family transcriptional regulator n=1 Tax=Streptomyces sp. TRM72054 TaxID=2870562 RepID=UPI001C8B0BFE|nr:MarR family transcriptional regulator [Streptomyces sp. TRM72054]MBX9392031.1 ArsR family transcriptional regulator [Streptomyces sp. TRM72054]